MRLWAVELEPTCQALDCGTNSDWFRLFVRYLKQNDLTWSYWPLNGTQSSGEGRKCDTIKIFACYRPLIGKSEPRKYSASYAD